MRYSIEDLSPNERICLAIIFSKIDPDAWRVQIRSRPASIECLAR
ncbi:MAG TPA: hypothetical protein VNO30_49030 [Kofleriaceae bacterium]|nr:hypothetical protein [Kofleriaceae bacterium]